MQLNPFIEDQSKYKTETPGSSQCIPPFCWARRGWRIPTAGCQWVLDGNSQNASGVESFANLFNRTDQRLCISAKNFANRTINQGKRCGAVHGDRVYSWDKVSYFHLSVIFLRFDYDIGFMYFSSDALSPRVSPPPKVWRNSCNTPVTLVALHCHTFLYNFKNRNSSTRVETCNWVLAI